MESFKPHETQYALAVLHECFCKQSYSMIELNSHREFYCLLNRGCMIMHGYQGGEVVNRGLLFLLKLVVDENGRAEGALANLLHDLILVHFGVHHQLRKRVFWSTEGYMGREKVLSFASCGWLPRAKSIIEFDSPKVPIWLTAEIFYLQEA